VVTVLRLAGGIVAIGVFFILWGALLPTHVPAIVLYFAGAFLIAVGLYLTWGYFRYVKKPHSEDGEPPR
jgi:hypothetical protein